MKLQLIVFDNNSFTVRGDFVLTHGWKENLTKFEKINC